MGALNILHVAYGYAKALALEFANACGYFWRRRQEPQFQSVVPKRDFTACWISCDNARCGRDVDTQKFAWCANSDCDAVLCKECADRAKVCGGFCDHCLVVRAGRNGLVA